MSLYITLYNTSKNRLITYESPTLSIDCPSLGNWLGEKPNFCSFLDFCQFSGDENKQTLRIPKKKRIFASVLRNE